ncbi:Mitotic checkpoint protein BUB3.3 [Heracleum sosnowskyi]|uniref:Mitotic checkpoint protein BUB3.3 n=1 Tax=Heracleum sosnowskyi TaxID=360622 RepID=A0AAD8M702_9APIA|nr:Mitotic checkpoint protein BUB3.3 [Heracleum sosnowskyi]
MNSNGTCLNFEPNPIEDAISRIHFAPTSNNLLISSWDSNLRLFDTERCKLRAQTRTEAPILDCCFQDESFAFTASADCSIKRYEFNSGHVFTLGNHDDLATHVDFSSETCQVITAGLDRKIKFWDIRSTEALKCLNSISVEVDSLSLSGVTLMVAAGPSVHMYDLRKFDRSTGTQHTCMDSRITCVRPSINFEEFVVGSIDGRVAVKSTSTFDGYTFRCHPKKKNGRTYPVTVNDIAFIPFISGAFVTGDNEGYVIVWNAHSKRRLLEFPRYPNGIASLSLNHSGHLLAVASSYTYQAANIIEESPQIFIQKVDECNIQSYAAGNSK